MLTCGIEVGPRIWAKVLMKVVGFTYHFVRALEGRGPDEMTPRRISLFIDIFYSRLPIHFVVAIFLEVLDKLKKR